MHIGSHTRDRRHKVLYIYTRGKTPEAHIGHTRGTQGIGSHTKNIRHNTYAYQHIGSEGYTRHIQGIQGIASHKRNARHMVLCITHRIEYHGRYRAYRRDKRHRVT